MIIKKENEYIATVNLDKKLKVAMIGHKRVPSREGGVEVVVEELSKRMVKMGHDIHVYNRKGNHVSGKEYNNKSENLEYYEGIKLIDVFCVNKKGLAALTSSIFATIIAIFEKYDIIHFHAEGSCAMLWLPKIFGIKTIATIHGLDWERSKWGKFAKCYLRFGEMVAAKFADEVIVLSNNVKEYFKDTYGRKVIFISNGIDKPKNINAKEIIDRWNLRKDDYILYLGRIVPEKGLEYLVDAFNEINSEKKLIIAGGSSDTNDFMDLIKEKSKYNKNIIFTGFVQGKLLEELYSNAYAYVLPSDIEGMPISLLEAMSYGNCCLVSDIPECTEVVEDKAIIFKKSNTKDLKNKLEWIIDNPYEVDRYKSISSEYICNKYNWDLVVENTLALYKN